MFWFTHYPSEQNQGSCGFVSGCVGSFLITVLALRREGKTNWSNSVLHCLQSCSLGLFAVVEQKTAKPGERLVAIVQEKQTDSASREMFWRKRNADYMRREERALFIEIKRKLIIYLHAERKKTLTVFKIHKYYLSKSIQNMNFYEWS